MSLQERRHQTYSVTPVDLTTSTGASASKPGSCSSCATSSLVPLHARGSTQARPLGPRRTQHPTSPNGTPEVTTTLTFTSSTQVTDSSAPLGLVLMTPSSVIRTEKSACPVPSLRSICWRYSLYPPRGQMQ